MGVVNKMALNVLVTFFRMATTVGIGLYTVRLLVNALGITDYGIYGLLGGGAAMLTVIQASLVQTAQRHLAYTLGKQDEEELKAVFSTTLALFLLAALAVFVVGLVLTPLVVEFFDYPDDRRTAVLVTWIVMTATVSLVVARAPYMALFIARQAMGQEAILATLSSLILLSIALGVSNWPGDRLIFFSFLLLAMRIVEGVLYATVGIARFPEGRPRPSLVRRDLFRELVSFGGWSMLDAIALRLRHLGGNMLLNPFFGPGVNAAYTLGNQLRSYELTIARTIQRAAGPVIIQNYASGQMDFVRKLVLSVGRISTLMLAAFCIPLVLEIDLVLEMWVKDVPDYAAAFSVAMLLTVLVEQTSAGFISANQAYGDVRLFNVVTILTLALTLGGSCLAFSLGYGEPTLLAKAALAGMVFTVIFRAWHVGLQIDLPFRMWVSQVVGRCILVIGPSVAIAYSVQSLFPNSGWERLFAVCVCFWSSLGTMVWCIGLQEYEKNKILAWIGKLARSTSFLGK